jgi:hypothetical protein
MRVLSVCLALASHAMSSCKSALRIIAVSKSDPGQQGIGRLRRSLFDPQRANAWNLTMQLEWTSRDAIGMAETN